MQTICIKSRANGGATDVRRTRGSLRKIAILISVFLFTFAANSVMAANDRGLLLKAHKDDKTVYLLGSIHLADKSFYPLRETIEQAYNESDVLVVEADVVAMESDPELQRKVMLESLYPPGQRLKDHLPPEIYTQLQEWLRMRHIPEANFNRMRPAIAMITLSLIEMQARGLDPKAGIDRHFLNQAHKEGKTTLELESVLEQLAMLNSLENPELYLKQTLNQLSEMDTFVPRITNAWKRGDQNDIYNLVIREGMQEHPEYEQLYELLFFKRNREMADKIDDFSRQYDTLFVVVGAGHLVGEKSITNLLQSLGFSVKQI